MQHTTELSLRAVQARGPLTVQIRKINMNNCGCHTDIILPGGRATQTPRKFLTKDSELTVE